MANIMKTYTMTVRNVYSIDKLELEMRIDIRKFKDSATILKRMFGQEALEFYRFILGIPDCVGPTYLVESFDIHIVFNKKNEVIQINIFKIDGENVCIKKSIDYPMDKSPKWSDILKNVFDISIPIEETCKEKENKTMTINGCKNCIHAKVCKHFDIICEISQKYEQELIESLDDSAEIQVSRAIVNILCEWHDDGRIVRASKDAGFA